MITLGSYTLNTDMIWSDMDSWSPVSQSVKRTLGGKIVVKAEPLVTGRPITLEAIADQGWLTLTQRNMVIQMAGVSGGIFTLVIDSDTFTVMFRHDEPPAVEFQPIIARTVPLAGDYFLGKIKLLTI